MTASRLIGREREVSALIGMMHDQAVRLVPVSGPAGVGLSDPGVAAEGLNL
jgi:hypothetical protein